MKYIPVLLTCLVTLTIIVILTQNPSLSATPGELSVFHRGLKNDCNNCHVSFGGVPSAKCLNCHKIDTIGSDNTSFHPVKYPFHKYLINTNCITCHTEHNGDAGLITKRIFDHELLQSSVKSNCSICHTKPSDNLHGGFNSECSSCHSTLTWKGASFDHQKYFIFDNDHPGKCENCHSDPNTFKSWTCYNCHEHSQENISRKHSKEGINDFANCIKCHRSSSKPDEHEGKSSEHERKHEKSRESEHEEREHDED